PVGGVQMDGNAAEGAAPFHHRGVVMRVGDGDAGEPAERLHDLDGGGIDERDAVPQNIAFGSAQDERALADGKFRHRPDADQAALVLLIAIEVPARERLEGSPLLTAGRNELTLVLTDRAGARRLIRRRKLAAAGLADEGGHHTTRHVNPMRFVPQRAAQRNGPRGALRRGGGAAASVLARDAKRSATAPPSAARGRQQTWPADDRPDRV